MLMVDIMLVRSGCFQQEAKPAPPSTKPALKCGFDELMWFYMEMNQNMWICEVCEAQKKTLQVRF